MIRKALFAISLLLLLPLISCGNFGYDTAESGLETTYRIGNNGTVVATTTSPIQTMYQDLPQLPFAPFNPAPGSGFKGLFTIDNGGHVTNGVGNLNMVTFRVNFVPATTTPPVAAHYTAAADIWKADAFGHSTLTTNAVTATAPPRWGFTFDWEAGDLGLGVFDAGGNWVSEVDYPLTFPFGPALTRIHSPEVDFTVDSGTSGCHSDIPYFDDEIGGHKTGHYYIETWAGPTVDTQIQAIPAAPLSNAKCSITNVLTGSGDDYVGWEVSGFN